ncbi:MAG: flagellar hook-basal body complex protein, partial [Defluviitaleaceae bacterium]|nr:flagellar hook-basal body complex protein [Defluviitaleaceae bacterium]
MRFDGPMFEVPPGTPTDPPPDAGLGGMYSVFGQIHSTMPGQADDAEDFIRAIRMCFRAMLQHEGRNNVTFTDVNGREAGTLIGISIGQDGIVSGTYSNGESRELWQIAMARFSNPAGLMRMGNSLFAQTRNSGTFDGIGFEPGAIGANLLGGTLEMSNVDLGFEFTEMITTQRGFQANSRIITTTDEMLQELVNLRR